MKEFDKLIRVSKKEFSEKLFDLDENKLLNATEEELEKIAPFLPSQDEKDFLEIMRSQNPQLARLQRKMSVCLDVEVTELEEDSIVFLFGKDEFKLTAPKNAFKICQALEKSVLDGVTEMGAQGCIFKNCVGYNIRATDVSVDEIQIVKQIADKFFFRTSLA